MPMNASLFLARLKNWGIKGGLSLLDQGLYSGANFILSILLARWLAPAHYGVYSIAFAVYQFAYQTHNAIILEPMSVLGPATMYHRLADYLREQIKLHFAVSFLAGLGICILGLLVLAVNQTLGRVLAVMGMVLPLILLPLLMRRGFYLFRKPEFALLGSMLYAMVLAGALWAARVLTDLSVDLAFPIIGLAGLGSGWYLIRQIPSGESATRPARVVWHDNWNYGKWLVYSSLMIALAAQAQTFVVAGVLGLSEAGVFRALQNFVQPMILFFTAISALLLPSLSYDFGQGNMAGLKLKGQYLFTLFLIVSVSFAAILSLYSSPLEAFLYDGTFSAYVGLLPIWGLVPIAAGMTYVYYFLLQSLQRPRSILIGSVVWSVTSIVLSVAFSRKWGIAGASVSVAATYLISGIVFAFLYRYYILRSGNVRSVR